MSFKRGDRVRVKEISVIRDTLDSNSCYDGLLFDQNMKHYCGRVFTVLKKVSKILDYYNEGIRKLSHTYILEGVNCQGSEDYPECDRMCFFFWKELWLEEADPQQEESQ